MSSPLEATSVARRHGTLRVRVDKSGLGLRLGLELGGGGWKAEIHRVRVEDSVHNLRFGVGVRVGVRVRVRATCFVLGLGLGSFEIDIDGERFICWKLHSRWVESMFHVPY